MSAQPASPPATTAEHALYYIGLGWGLCSIPRGTKGPSDDGWNSPALVIDTREKALATIANRPDNGLGLVHASSGTCAIDVDHLEHFAACLAEFGLDVETLFAHAPRIVGKAGRDKAIFRLPEGFEPGRRSLAWPKQTPAGKPVTIFELRGGAVQDVLPPTIHPDTHQPYRWREGTAPWELLDIPELPAPLVHIWQSWNSFKAQFMALCPWAPQAVEPPPARRRREGPNDNVIGQFNMAHDLTAMLKAYGYKPVGKRWLSPTSDSGLPGVVVFEDGTHCYSHHASDPLNDGHAHDAFDLFCLLQHDGDINAAIRAASELLGLDWQRPAPIPAADLAGFIANSKARKATPTPAILDTSALDTPSHLLRLPGALGAVVDLANRSAPKPQPQFAVQAALALGCAVLGRRYMTSRNNWPSLYLVNVGKSASGKEHGRTVIDAILTEAKLGHLMGPGGYTSDGAVFSAAINQPCHLAIIDELGALLGNAKAMGNFHKRQALDALTQAWGLLHGTLRPQGYSTMSLTPQQVAQLATRVVHRPAISLLGMTTPRTFYGALTEQAIEGGFLNRLLIVESQIGRQLSRPADLLEVPASVVDWCLTARRPAGEGNLAGLDPAHDMVPVPHVVAFASDAQAAFAAYEEACLSAMDLLDAENLGELEGRSVEKALRIALILAVSDNVQAPRVRLEHAQWAIDYVRHYTAQTIAAVRKHMHGSQFAEWRAQILEVIAHGGVKGRTERELAMFSRTYAGLEPRQRKSLLDSLRADGLVAYAELKPASGRGRNRHAWVALDVTAEDDHVE